MYHNPCFNLLILHNNSFATQGSEINKNDIFLRFDILSFIKTFFLLYIFLLYIYMYIYRYIGFQQKWDAILFNAERNLVELLLVETDSVIKKIELDLELDLISHTRNT